MEMSKRGILRTDINYAAIQATFWVSWCAINSFEAVYLTHRGLNNTQIGFTTSLQSVIVILLQIAVGDFCDRHENVAIKKVISTLLIISVATTALLKFISMPLALMTVVFAVAAAFDKSVSGLISAQMMQFVNAGVKVHFGWTRGVGSISYAVFSYVIGVLIEKNSPDVVIPVFMAAAVASIICILAMPVPPKRRFTGDVGEKVAPEKVRSYGEMLKSNKPLMVFLVAATLSTIGKNAGLNTFLVRVIEGLGGGTRELGLCMFIQSVVEVPMMFASALVLKRFTPKHLLVVSFISDAAKIFVLSIATSLSTVYIAVSGSFLCFGIYGFASVMFVNGIVRGTEKVRAQALIALCASLGGIIGNFIAGVIIDLYGIRTVLTISACICFMAGIVMIICCRVIRRERQAGVAEIEA